MTTPFIVTGASAGREFDMLSAAFTDGKSHILLSRSIDPGDEDRILGLAGLHIEFSGQLASGYDLVSDIAWEGSTMRITLKTAAAAMGIPDMLRLQDAGNHLDPQGIAIISEMLLDGTTRVSRS